MLTIWGRKTSSNVQALMWCVGELQRGFHTREVEIRQGVGIEPEMQHASGVLMPAEKGKVAVKLQQQHVIAVLDRRTLPTAAVASTSIP